MFFCFYDWWETATAAAEKAGKRPQTNCSDLNQQLRGNEGHLVVICDRTSNNVLVTPLMQACSGLQDGNTCQGSNTYIDKHPKEKPQRAIP